MDRWIEGLVREEREQLQKQRWENWTFDMFPRTTSRESYVT